MAKTSAVHSEGLRGGGTQTAGGRLAHKGGGSTQWRHGAFADPWCSMPKCPPPTSLSAGKDVLVLGSQLIFQIAAAADAAGGPAPDTNPALGTAHRSQGTCRATNGLLGGFCRPSAGSTSYSLSHKNTAFNHSLHRIWVLLLVLVYWDSRRAVQGSPAIVIEVPVSTFPLNSGSIRPIPPPLRPVKGRLAPRPDIHGRRRPAVAENPHCDRGENRRNVRLFQPITTCPVFPTRQ